jgi:hypothetical protein
MERQMTIQTQICTNALRRSFQIACALLPFVGFQAKAASIPIFGIGATTPCSTWTYARGHQPAANDLENWALGYVSGQEMGMSTNFLTGTNAATLFTGIDTQCQTQPEGSVADAVDVLVMRLKEGI